MLSEVVVFVVQTFVPGSWIPNSCELSQSPTGRCRVVVVYLLSELLKHTTHATVLTPALVPKLLGQLLALHPLVLAQLRTDLD